MRKIMKRLLFVLSAALAISAAVFGVRSNPTIPPEDSQHLEGSWIVTTTIEGQSPFKSLATLIRDGGVVESHLDPSLSAAHGVWARTGNREFAVTAMYLRTDEFGEFAGTARVRSTFVLDQTLNKGTGRFQSDVFDVNGNLVRSFRGTNEATRIQVE